jgi:hypothetical protein
MGLIGRKKSACGSAGADANLYFSAAFRATAHVGRFAGIDVNPYVDVATGEMNAHKTAICSFWGGGQLGVTIQIKFLTGHFRTLFQAYFTCFFLQ